MLLVVLYPGTPEGSTGSGSGFKASQKTGQRLKVSSNRQNSYGLCLIIIVFKYLLHMVFSLTINMDCLFVWCLTTHQPLWVISVRRY